MVRRSVRAGIRNWREHLGGNNHQRTHRSQKAFRPNTDRRYIGKSSLETIGPGRGKKKRRRDRKKRNRNEDKFDEERFL